MHPAESSLYRAHINRRINDTAGFFVIRRLNLRTVSPQRRIVIGDQVLTPMFSYTGGRTRRAYTPWSVSRHMLDSLDR